MDLQLADRVYIVTGGSRGLGLATARALLQDGARVVLAARGEEALQATAQEWGPTNWSPWRQTTPMLTPRRGSSQPRERPGDASTAP